MEEKLVNILNEMAKSSESIQEQANICQELTKEIIAQSVYINNILNYS